MKLVQKYKKIPIQVKASTWFLICAFLQKGISVITTPIFTRLLSTTEYGQYSVFNSWQGILTIVITLNLSAGVYTTGLVKFNEMRNQYSSALQGLTLTMSAVWFIIYLFSKQFWNSLLGLSTVQMISMLIMIWTTAVFLFWSSEQRVDYKYRLLVVVTLVASISKPLLGIILVIHSEDKVTARILGLVIVEICCYSAFFFIQMIKGKHFFSKEIWLYALRFNAPLIPHYLSTVVLNNSDRIMISKIVGESQTGIYSLAYSISLLMMLFNTAVQQTMIPWMYKKIHDKKANEIASIAYPAMIIIAGLNTVLIMLAPEVLRIFAPSSYYEAVFIIPPVAMSVFFIFVYNLFVPFEFYYEKTKYIAVSSVCAAIMNIILNFFCIKRFGYIAAGYTTLICYVLNMIFHYFFMIKVCREKSVSTKIFSYKIIILISILFVIIGFTLLFLYNFTIVRYVLIFGTCISIIVFRKKLFVAIKAMKK